MGCLISVVYPDVAYRLLDLEWETLAQALDLQDLGDVGAPINHTSGSVLRADGTDYDEAQLGHVDLSGKGTNTHDQIDTHITNTNAHIADSTDPHGSTLTQTDLDVDGTITAGTGTAVYGSKFNFGRNVDALNNNPTAGAHFKIEQTGGGGTSAVPTALYAQVNVADTITFDHANAIVGRVNQPGEAGTYNGVEGRIDNNLSETFEGRGIRGIAYTNATTNDNVTLYGGKFIASVTGGSSTGNMVGLYSIASGGAINYAGLFDGNLRVRKQGATANWFQVEHDGTDVLFTRSGGDYDFDGGLDAAGNIVPSADNQFTLGLTSGTFRWKDIYAVTKTAIVDTKDYGRRKLFVRESPTYRFIDEGEGTLADGTATITIEPIFKQTVDTKVPYIVQVTALGDCNGLYVSDRQEDTFTVKELGGGTSNVSFMWTLSAIRLGWEDERLTEVKRKAISDETSGFILDEMEEEEAVKEIKRNYHVTEDLVALEAYEKAHQNRKAILDVLKNKK